MKRGSSSEGQSFDCIIPAEKQEGSLWLGDIEALANKFLFKNNNITHVISCIKDFNPENRLKLHLKPTEFPKILHLPLRDKPDQDIIQYFEQAYDFIQSARSQGQSVLVHCLAGISRSATIVCSYVMRKFGLGCYKAVDYVQKKRDCVSPNKGFTTQLLKYQELLESRQANNREQQIQHAEAVNSVAKEVQNMTISESKPIIVQQPKAKLRKTDQNRSKKPTDSTQQNPEPAKQQNKSKFSAVNQKAMLSYLLKNSDGAGFLLNFM